MKNFFSILIKIPKIIKDIFNNNGCVPKQILYTYSYNHEFFKDPVVGILYIDYLNRIQCEQIGTNLNKEFKTTKIKNKVYIDELGGMSWKKLKSHDYFICRHRTSIQEFLNNIDNIKTIYIDSRYIKKSIATELKELEIERYVSKLLGDAAKSYHSSVKSYHNSIKEYHESLKQSIKKG